MGPKWSCYTHRDGTEQVFTSTLWAPCLVIERYTTRKGYTPWFVVRRKGEEWRPTRIAGPFDDLDAAKVAYLFNTRRDLT